MKGTQRNLSPKSETFPLSVEFYFSAKLPTSRTRIGQLVKKKKKKKKLRR
jgi:hypothetical protein